ncbi:MAG: DMT family transporter [Prolixibacteraceae bacterium]|jgi:drug/metabolite transporter (DMT)-like permease|nr:DMT family transporter [Prolixibacteraceae bacterium]
MNRQQKAYLFALAAVFCWSTVATAFKIGLQYLPVLHLILVASVTSFFVFLLIVLWQKRNARFLAGGIAGIRRSALLGALNPLIYYLVLFSAYNLLPAQVAQPLNMVWPIMLSLLSVPFLKQKLTWRHVVAIFTSFSGILFISSQGRSDGFTNTSFVGVALALSASILWSLYWIFNVRDKRPEPVKLCWNFFFGSLYLLVAVGLFPNPDFHWGAGILAGIYIGLFELGIAYIFWMQAMLLSENNAQIGNLVFIAPFVSLIFIHFFLHETIYYTTFIGLLFIVGGIVIQQVKPKFNMKK